MIFVGSAKRMLIRSDIMILFSIAFDRRFVYLDVSDGRCRFKS